MADKPKSTSIDQSLISRLSRGLSVILGNEQQFFPPGEPLKPVAQESSFGRLFDYQSGVNINIRSRNTQGGVDFAQLRAIADSFDLLRLVIETRKDQMAKLKWTVKPIDEKAKADERCKEIIKRLRFPNRELDWNAWLRALLEDLLVLDAATILPRKTLGGGIYSLDLIDGSTINRLIDDTGRTPMPPEPAYQQILKGVPASEYTLEELIYAPRNVRTHRMYGYSPVEQIIMTVNIALRRQITQLQYFTEGNIPEALISTPAEWTPDQIADYQMYWDTMIEGDQSFKRKAKFVPDGMKLQLVRPDLMKDEFDEWLARVICYAFSISPSFLIQDQNRSTSETQKELAQEEGLAPLMLWLEGVLTRIIHQHFGFEDLEFKFEAKEAVDPEVQARVNQIYLGSGVKTANEVRAELGLDPIQDETANQTGAQQAAAIASQTQEKPEVDPNAKAKDEPTQEDDTEAEKLAKAKKKKVVPINRNRPAIVDAQDAIIGLATNWQAEALKTLIKSVNKVNKADLDIPSLIDKIIEDWVWDLDTVKGALRGILLNIFVDGAETAEKQLFIAGIELNVSFANDMAERAVKSAEQRAAILITDIAQSTRDMVRGTIADALEQGLSNQELAKELSNSYAFSPERAEVIARTETAIADVEGNLEAYQAAGVEQKQWILGDDACDDCVSNAAQGPIPFNDDFSDGSFAPPAHPNCRCDVIPVL